MWRDAVEADPVPIWCAFIRFRSNMVCYVVMCWGFTLLERVPALRVMFANLMSGVYGAARLHTRHHLTLTAPTVTPPTGSMMSSCTV